MNERKPQRYFRAPVIATRTGVSLRTVRRWIANGSLPSSKIGGTRLVAEADLDRLLHPEAGPDRDAPACSKGQS